jgi:hypothetical protein
MGYWLPSYWFRRLVHYGLSLFLDIDFDRVDVALGRKSVLELHDVAIKREVSSENTQKMHIDLCS